MRENSTPCGFCPETENWPGPEAQCFLTISFIIFYTFCANLGTPWSGVVTIFLYLSILKYIYVNAQNLVFIIQTYSKFLVKIRYDDVT